MDFEASWLWDPSTFTDYFLKVSLKFAQWVKKHLGSTNTETYTVLSVFDA